MPRAVDSASGVVTLDDIARKLGITKATVSRALNQQPCVAEETRNRVVRAAQELGYEPDPALRALSNRRWNKTTRPFRYPVALVHMHRSDAVRLRDGSRSKMYPAIEDAAERLGVGLSVFYLSDYEKPDQFNRILRARGIEGVLLNIERPVLPWRFAWESLSFVSLGLGCEQARHVASDWFGAVNCAVTEARALGYRRIGHLVLRHGNPGIEQQIAAAIGFTRTAMEAEVGPQPSSLVVPATEGRPERFREVESLFTPWFEAEKPDVIVDGTQLAMRMLEARGWRPGARPGLITLFRRYAATHDAIASVEHHFEEQGRLAVEMLASLIQHRMRGLPALPARVVVPCSWHPGASLPRLST